MFQSSPGPKAGRNAISVALGYHAVVFQSSPGPKAGRNCDKFKLNCASVLGWRTRVPVAARGFWWVGLKADFPEVVESRVVRGCAEVPDRGHP